VLALPTSTYPALFAAIGYTFGGAGFGVLTCLTMFDRMPIGSGNLYSVGSTGGSNTTTITSTNMPAHTHTFSASASGGGSGSFSGQTDGVGDHTHGGSFMGPSNSGQTGRTDAAQATNFGSTGGGGAHSHSYSGSVYVPVTLSMSGTTSSAGSRAAFPQFPHTLVCISLLRLKEKA